MRKEIYWKGDKIELTGNVTFKHKGLFHEALLLEGHRAGEKIWVSHDYLDERNYFTSTPEVLSAK